MRVGILGNHWGRTHCGTFRRAGCEIHAIVGLDAAVSARIAFEERVLHSTPDALREADIIVIATPASTHRRFVEAYADKPILCEKPLLGVVPDRPFLSLLPGTTLFVNYAFPFLPSARAFQQILRGGGVGQVQHVDLVAEVALPSIGTPTEALIEVAVHPLAFLITMLGPLRATDYVMNERFIRMSFASGGPTVSLVVTLGEREGFWFDLGAAGSRNRLCLAGGYRPDTRWRFEAVLLDKDPVFAPVFSDGQEIWYEANCALVAAFVSLLQGGATASASCDAGLLDGDQALEVERALAPVLQRLHE